VKGECENGHEVELSPEWRGNIGHWLVPYNIIESKRVWVRLLVRLWGVMSIVSMILVFYLYDHATREGIIGGGAMVVVFTVSLWHWMTKRQDYPSGVGYFAITPEEAVGELKISELNDGSFEVRVKRHKIKYVEDAGPFRQVQFEAGKWLHN